MSTSPSPVQAMFLHSSDDMYGADKILAEILTALPEKDKTNALVHFPDDLPTKEGRLSAHLKNAGIQVVVSPLPVLRRRYLTPSGILPLISKMWRTFGDMRKQKPDVVYCTTTALILCVPLARLAGVKRVVLHVQEIWSPRESLVLGKLARFATHIFCISNASLRSISDKGASARAELLLNAHRESGRMLSAKPLVGPMKFVVASRWNSWKGHATLLEAWDAAGCPGELVILGGPPSRGMGVDVPHLVNGLANPDSVKVVGEVGDIEPYIDGADYLILPSDSPEPFGLVILEAFARSRAVIASRAGGVVDILEDKETGHLYEIGNAEELSKLLKVANRRQATALGVKARERYISTHSIDAYHLRFQELWRRTTAQGAEVNSDA